MLTIYAPNGYVQCPHCAGRGSDRYGQCSTCEGKGTMSLDEYEKRYCIFCGKEKNFIRDDKGICDNEDCPKYVEDEDAYWKTHR